MVYKVIKKPWLGALFVFIFGPFGFLYYSWKKAVVTLLLFGLPNLMLYNLNSTFAEIVRWVIQISLAVFAYLDLKDKQRTLDNILSILFITKAYPIIILNFLGLIIGGIWLLVLGNWELVVGGIIIIIVVPYMYLIVALFQMPLTALLVYLQNRNKIILGLMAGFLSILISHVFILIYVFYTINIAIMISESNNISIMALLLFGYGVATGPFSYMASKEDSEAIASDLGVLISQISYIILAITYLANYPAVAFPIIFIIVFGIEIFQLNMASQTREYNNENYEIHDY